MQITGTHFNYYMLCYRKLWLSANDIKLEHTSDLVYEGRLIHESSYAQRSEKFQEVELGGIKVDYYDPKNKVIHEVKKSDKKSEAHLWQLKYYIYVFEQYNITEVSGMLEYPKLRKTEEVFLSDVDRSEIEIYLDDIKKIISADDCPKKLDVKKCRKCSYFDFCHVDEVIE